MKRRNRYKARGNRHKQAPRRRHALSRDERNAMKMAGRATRLKALRGILERIVVEAPDDPEKIIGWAKAGIEQDNRRREGA